MNKIEEVFGILADEYKEQDNCMGDFLDTVNVNRFDITMHEAFVVNMMLREWADGDSFFRQLCTEWTKLERFDSEYQWFNESGCKLG